MSKGPKVDLPEELRTEFQNQDDTPAQAARSDADPLSGDAEIPDEAAEAESSDAAHRSDSDGDEDPQKQLEALNDRYLRLAAEFENFKRRALKERQDLHSYANENLIKELLPTVDNLERAVGHARQEESDRESLLEGVELTYRSLLQLLEKLGVQRIEPEGESFDPAVHEAIRQVPSDEHEPGIVIEVFQRGYKLKDRLIRAALVAVSSGSASE